MPLNPDVLATYVNQARSILIREARKGNNVKYNQLMGEMGGPGRGYIGEVLEEVTDSENKLGRPILSSIVVHQNGLGPGEGFWRLGCISPTLKNSPRSVKIAFWQAQCQNVWNYWKVH